MVSKELRISGMSCGHCVMAVRKALSSLAGVQVKDVKIGSASIAYDETKVNEQAIHEAVEEAGYEVAG